MRTPLLCTIVFSIMIGACSKSTDKGDAAAASAEPSPTPSATLTTAEQPGADAQPGATTKTPAVVTAKDGGAADAAATVTDGGKPAASIPGLPTTIPSGLIPPNIQIPSALPSGWKLPGQK